METHAYNSKVTGLKQIDERGILMQTERIGTDDNNPSNFGSRMSSRDQPIGQFFNKRAAS